MELTANTGPMPLNFSVAKQANSMKHNSSKRKSSKHRFHGFDLARAWRVQQCDFGPYLQHPRTFTGDQSLIPARPQT
jgi:hypothetical protein